MKKRFVCLVALLAASLISSAVSAQNSRDFNKPKGYMGIVELSTGGSINGLKGAPVAVTMVNGYRFAPHFAIGLGTGVQVILENSVIPVFLHLRSDIMDNWISPYVAFNAGWNFALSNTSYSGLTIEPSLGVGFNAGSRSRVTVGAFCAINQIRVYQDPIDSYRDNGYYQAANNCVMGLKVGMSF